MKVNLNQLIRETIFSGITNQSLRTLAALLMITIIFLCLAWVIDRLVRKLLVGWLNELMLNANYFFFVVIARTKILNIISLFIIAIIFDFSSAWISFKGADDLSQAYASFLLRLAYTGYFLVGTLIISRAISAISIYYEHKFAAAGEYPIYGYIKMAQFIIWCFGIISYLSFMFNQSPLAALTGIGAVSAFVLLIFKDTFLGLVSSIQATANHIVKLGDWVNIPKYEVDGEVISISVSTIKIRNWDNTITTIPTFALTTDAIHNWQAMVNAKARRIMRTIHFDLDSVCLCNYELLQQILTKYPQLHMQVQGMDTKYTNLALFRMYLNIYLSNNPRLNQNYINLVRYLPPNLTGVSLQIYAYSCAVFLVEYEETFAQIFEHILLSLADFKLRLFQVKQIGV